ncbi:amidohydrolase family protein [Pseudonocardia sp. ICBG1293]|uniref:metal-dependent hydrolase family protein n=1 Tax=Pseudonocardia sp. ICBG1293 TaxID=2844382 RepID=UPI001CCB00AC|nr:amidohydrolase family protein [Pseudonocardia sp. ICBG1293]
MSARLLVRGGTVFDPQSGTASAADVVVDGERIVAVGSGLDGDQDIDATGMLVVPGFIDCHVHVTIDRIDLSEAIQAPFSLRFFHAVRNLAATLQAGVTTARDAAGADLGVKQAVATGIVAGPDLRIAIGMLSQTGGHADEWMASGGCLHALWPAYPGAPSTVVDGVDEIRRTVRELIRAGADVIKIATTGGVVSPRSNPRHAHFRDDELDAVIAEATAAGLSVMAHAQGTAGIKNAVRAGVRSIEHGVFLDEEAVTMMLERDTWLVPTLSAPDRLMQQAADGILAESTRSKVVDMVEAHHASLRLARDAGVRIAMGSDAGVATHGRNLREIELMGAHGLTPVEALRAATTSAAHLLGADDEIGVIAPGKVADLVLLQGTEISVSDLESRVRTVVRRGTVVRHDTPTDT